MTSEALVNMFLKLSRALNHALMWHIYTNKRHIYEQEKYQQYLENIASFLISEYQIIQELKRINEYGNLIWVQFIFKKIYKRQQNLSTNFENCIK